MKLSSEIKFADEKLKKAFEQLRESKGDEKALYGWLVRAFKDIESNAFCGIQIPKKLIPREYLQKYGVHNVWKYNLPNAWRLIYSVENQEIVVVSIVLEWMNHKEYERRFKY
jgi:Txe/YoeB family toxin of Txe-Axe toxin-antitoxin module